MNTPIEKDINVHNSPDEISASKNFLNKTREEAATLFAGKNGFNYLEDLMWMGPKAFAYYLQSAFDYLRVTKDMEQDTFLSMLYTAVEFHCEHDENIDLARETINELTDFVLEHYDEFDINEVYSDLRQKYQDLKDQLSK